MTLSPREYVHIEVHCDLTVEDMVRSITREALEGIELKLKEENYKPYIEFVIHGENSMTLTLARDQTRKNLMSDHDVECDEDCEMCSGEYCRTHFHDPCDCDVIDRHKLTRS